MNGCPPNRAGASFALARGVNISSPNPPSKVRFTLRPWITLAVGMLTTTLVDVGRVRAGVHFPTDVLAGTTAGIGIGVLVPHLHRTASPAKTRVSPKRPARR